jgi:hypothetical protein
MVLQELEWEVIKWITEDKDKWRALVNAVMNLLFPKIWGISLLTEGGHLSFSGRTLVSGVNISCSSWRTCVLVQGC